MPVLPFSDSVYQAVYKMVATIPAGRVATYGQIARLIGLPRHARQVGFALAALARQESLEVQVPWHRVVNARGQISLRGMGDSDQFQRVLLESEGVLFGDGGRICLKQFQWVSPL